MQHYRAGAGAVSSGQALYRWASVLELRKVEAAAVPGLAVAWEGLAGRAARSPFELPAWLLPWLRHYGTDRRAFLLTWWRAGELVAVAPLAWRRRRLRGIPVRELEFWGRTGTPLRGWVDLLVDEADREEVSADLGRWLARSSVGWDLFHVLHMAPDSPTLAALSSGRLRWRVGLTRVLHSQEYVLALPADGADWRGPLGAKARHEVRRQARLFERRGGRLEVVSDPDHATLLVAALHDLMTRRWQGLEAYFRRDPVFADFFATAVRSLLGSGAGRVFVARDGHGIQACLVTMVGPPNAVAAMMGVTSAPEYEPLSLGKCLFEAAIRDAATRGCRTFSFLTEDGYKESFWRATRRPVECGFVARGPIGLLLAAGVIARRVLPASLRDLLRGHWRDRYRP